MVNSKYREAISAQPTVDAGLLRYNKVKFAMAVGSNRHYVVGDILPRHFRQIANTSGVPDASVENIFAELGRDVPGALEKTAYLMPPGFPRIVIDSFTRGVLNRLRLLEQAAQNA